MLVYFHGNCQARALSQMIAPVFPEWKVKQYEVFTDTIVSENETYRNLVTTADVIITQPIHPGYRNRKDLSLDWISGNAKTGAAIVVFPSMYFDGQLIGHSALSRPAYEMEYHDILLLKFVADGLSEVEICKRMMSDNLYDEAFISSELTRATIEMDRREVVDRVDVPFSPFLREFAHETQLFHTVNHPYRPTLAWMGNKLLRYLGYDREIPDIGEDYIWHPHLPCSPTVLRYFGSRPQARPNWLVDEAEIYHLKAGRMSRNDYLSRAVTFLKASPRNDLDACLQDHRAEQFLKRLRSAMPIAFSKPVRSNKVIAPTPTPDDLLVRSTETSRELMMQFESLGGSGHGCEFGLIQREFGAEPLGLLRWADLGPEQLTAALTNLFDGVGEDENTEIFQPQGDGWKEWWTRDKRYWMAMRSFCKAADVTYLEMQKITAKKQRFLRAKLVSDLRDGDKIFVYKNMYYDLSEEKLHLLHAAVRSYGENILLYTQYETDQYPNGMVRVAASGLLIGYIDHFGYSPKNEPIGPATDAIVAICREAAKLRYAASAWNDAPAHQGAETTFTTVDDALQRARLAFELDDPQAALRISAEIRHEEPGHSGAYLLTARVLGKLGRDSEVEALFAEGLQHCPKDVSMYIGHASISQRLGNVDEAYRRWAFAYQRFPDNADIRENYSAALEATGQHDEAARVR